MSAPFESVVDPVASLSTPPLISFVPDASFEIPVLSALLFLTSVFDPVSSCSTPDVSSGRLSTMLCVPWLNAAAPVTRLYPLSCTFSMPAATVAFVEFTEVTAAVDAACLAEVVAISLVLAASVFASV